MIYQKLITGTKPYFFVMPKEMIYNALHRHTELEVCYCIKGSFDVIINGQTYHMEPGKLAIIGSLVPHKFPYCENILACTIEFGPTLLKDYFHLFSNAKFSPVYDLSDENSGVPHELQTLLLETSKHYKHPNKLSELLILGNVYKIANYVGQIFTGTEVPSPHKKDHMTVDNIEKALDLIYNHYSENITLEQAAALTGYGKTNFCRYFKSITGFSFHRFLNQHRIENACYYLCETKLSLSEIASLVGFADSKILCRVFKSYIGVTPGEYRQHNS